jgi:hypothetical protein
VARFSPAHKLKNVTAAGSLSRAGHTLVVGLA